MRKKDLQFYIDEFKSEECFCGREKKTKTSFCFKCYSSLPLYLRKGLYQKFENGYEEAYDTALRWLL